MKSGNIHLATDIPEYAEDWLKYKPSNWVITANDAWVDNRQQTKYESRGEHLGHRITDVVFTKLHEKFDVGDD